MAGQLPGTKTENGGQTAQGRLSASEFNDMVQYIDDIPIANVVNAQEGKHITIEGSAVGNSQYPIAHANQAGYANTSGIAGAVGTAQSNLTKAQIESAIDAKVPKTTTVNGHALSSNVTVTKGDIGLGNVNNTSDADKPISTATQTALDSKASKVKVNGTEYTSSGGMVTLPNYPSVPTVNNGTLTIQKNGTTVQTFSANQSGNATANITVPTQASDIGAQPVIDSSHKLSGSLISGDVPSASSCTGNAATATKLQTARKIQLTGHVIGEQNFDGSGNIQIATTLNGVDIDYDEQTVKVNGKELGTSEHPILNATNSEFAGSADQADADGEGNSITATYATKTELANGLSGKAAASHTHTKSDITDFAHDHQISQVAGLTTRLTDIEDDVDSLETSTTGISSALSNHVNASNPHGITAAGIGAASSSHTHGNITNDGKVGSAANKPIITGTDGVLQAGSFGTAAGTFCEGNDERLRNARPASGGTAEYAEKLGSSGGSYTFGNISTQFGNINTSLANLSTAVGNKVADVKIGNTSLLDSNKVASIPFADNSTDGILGHEEYEIFSETAETVSLNADDWSGKQDAISDLATIRSNASAGAAKISCTDAAVGGYGYTKNAGTVTQVKVGSTPFNPTSGVVSLPAYYTTSEMDAALAAKAPSSHAHTKSQITDFDHNHDGRYYTESEINTKLSGKQNTLSEGECIIIDGDFINVDTEIVALKEELPTKTSDLTNDSGFLTSHQDISGKVDKVTGKGLSTNDLTDALKLRIVRTDESIDAMAVGAVFHQDGEYFYKVGQFAYQFTNNGNTYYVNSLPTGSEEVNVYSDGELTLAGVLIIDLSYYRFRPIGETVGRIVISTSSSTKHYKQRFDVQPHQDISGKVNEPSSEGTSGQVLTTDGNGGRTWTTVQGGGTITDVQVNGSTIVSGGVANIPLANSTTDGVISKAFWSNLSGMYEDYNENGFQAQLVSGTNIKTINNQSLLGSGNIQIQGAYADVNVTVFFNTPSSTTQVTVDTSTSKLGRHNFYATVNGYDINISSGIYNNTLYLWYDEADPTTHGTLSRKWVRCEIGSGYITFLGSGTLTK